MRKHFKLVILVAWMLMVLSPVSAQAKWVKSTGGSYVWLENGKYYPSTWFSNKKSGFVTIGSTTWCYKLNGAKYKGFLTSGSNRYYINKNGKLLKSIWIVSGKKKYRADKNGRLHLNGISKVGSYSYAFNSSGVMLTGKRTFGGKTYYLDAKTGRMQTKKTVLISKKYYYFGANGVMVKNDWVGKYYHGSDGARVFNTWVQDRYVDSNGQYQTGLQKISGATYYLDPSTGKKTVSTTKTISGVTYVFDSAGKGSVKKTTVSASVPVEPTYSTDPQVKDETLLAAIIYCEAGNQPYYGKLAVGLVITNRMRSPLFAAKTLKEVIYATEQFTPARDGSLTRVLKNQSLITSECKKAASEVLSKYRTNNYTITVDGKQINMQNQLFFMTQKAYTRLKLTSKTTKIGDHVFFQTWKK